jgi:5,10-methylene-tetrahydrofolate dehydrogenase/methenyl tetrahydrofolate cyclohydrolase
MHSRDLQLPPTSSADELFGAIDGLNADPEVHGILVQLPLPSTSPKASWSGSTRARTWTASTR